MSSFVNLMVHPLTFYVNGMSFVILLVALVFTGNTGRVRGGGERGSRTAQSFGCDFYILFCLFVGSLVLRWRWTFGWFTVIRSVFCSICARAYVCVCKWVQAPDRRYGVIPNQTEFLMDVLRSCGTRVTQNLPFILWRICVRSCVYVWLVEWPVPWSLLIKRCFIPNR